jgi:hypothetical protein
MVSNRGGFPPADFVDEFLQTSLDGRQPVEQQRDDDADDDACE